MNISSKTTVLQLKKAIEKQFRKYDKVYPASSQTLRLRVNRSKAMDDDVVLWELGEAKGRDDGIIRAGTMPVHLGCYVGWNGVARGWTVTDPMDMAPEHVYAADK